MPSATLPGSGTKCRDCPIVAESGQVWNMLEVQSLREFSVQDEQALVRRAQQGDKEAFADLYESYFDKVYRYLTLETGSRAEAEDMTQQVFVKAYR